MKSRSILYSFVEATHELVDLFFPKRCAACGCVVDKSLCLCPSCVRGMRSADFRRTWSWPLVLRPGEHLYAWGQFMKEEALQRCVHLMKYLGRRDLAYFFGRQCGEALLSERVRIDALLPVPLHPFKRMRRGFNQAELMAKGLQEVLCVPVDKQLLRRKRYTRSQVKSGLKERQTQLKRAFALRREEDLSGQTFLLVDDVLTTGSTLSACLEALRPTGVRVHVLVLAYASQAQAQPPPQAAAAPAPESKESFLVS